MGTLGLPLSALMCMVYRACKDALINRLHIDHFLEMAHDDPS